MVLIMRGKSEKSSDLNSFLAATRRIATKNPDTKKLAIKEKLRDSRRGYLTFLRRPAWAILAILLAILISGLIYFSVNFGFYGSLIFSPMDFVAKISTIFLMLREMFLSYGKDFFGILLLLVSIFQGITIAGMIFAARHNAKIDKMIAGRSGLALVAATLGLGCVPCGTSLLIPLLTLIFSSSAPMLIGTANIIVLALALFLTIFSLYKIGLIVYRHRIAEVI